MKNYEELRKNFNEWLIRKGIIDQEYVELFGEQELPEVASNGIDENGNAVFSKEFKLPNGKYENYRWVEFSEEILDEDGEVTDYKIIGYEEA